MKAIFALLLSATLAAGETIYVSQSGSGTGTGADASNRLSASGFNTAGNWDTDVSDDGKIGPGDTVSLSGTLTTALVIQGSGTSGNYITILFESGAKLSAPYWTADGAIQGVNKDYIIIDGGNAARVGTRHDPYSTNHSLFQTNIECTANGEALANQQPTRGIVFVTACNDIIVKNLRTQNLYVKVPYSTDANEYGGAISLKGHGNLMISNCVIRMGIDGAIVSAEITNVLGLVVADCDIRQVSNGIKPGAASGTTSFTDAQVVRNRIDELGMWSAPPGGSIHHNDGIQLIIGSPGANSLRTVIAYNWLGPDLGTNGHTTSAIFCEDNSEETYIYNNLVTLGAGHWTANPAIQGIQTAGYSTGEGPGLIANNTIIGGGLSSGIASRHHDVINNIVYNVGNIFTRVTGVTGTNDYNVIYGISGDTDGQFYNGTVIYSRFTGTTPNWRTTEGMDPNTINQDPLVNSDGTLQSGSPAIGFGLDLSSIFADDFNGVTRTNWDAGAFEGTNAPPADSTPPTVSTVTIAANGTTWTLAMSESVSVGSGGNGGFSPTITLGSVTLTYSSGSGTSSLVYTGSRTVYSSETGTLAYTQPGNGIEDAAGNDLATFTGKTITNNSTQTASSSANNTARPFAFPRSLKIKR